MLLGKLQIHKQHNEVYTYFTPYTKLESKWVKNLNVRATTIQLLEENRGSLHDIGRGNEFLDMTGKAQAAKINTEKVNPSKLKTFVHKGHNQ